MLILCGETYFTERALNKKDKEKKPCIRDGFPISTWVRGLTHCHTSLATLSSDSFPLWQQKVRVEDPLQEVLTLRLRHLGEEKETEVRVRRQLAGRRASDVSDARSVHGQHAPLTLRADSPWREVQWTHTCTAWLLKRLIHFSGDTCNSEFTMLPYFLDSKAQQTVRHI